MAKATTERETHWLSFIQENPYGLTRKYFNVREGHHVVGFIRWSTEWDRYVFLPTRREAELTTDHLAEIQRFLKSIPFLTDLK